MRQFAVIGLGDFGSTVAKSLAERGLPVIGVDIDHERVDVVRDVVAYAVTGDATDATFLGGLGIADVDVALVALGDLIEASVLVTLYLHESDVKQIVVKGISEEHREILMAVGAHKVIFPEKEIAERVANWLAAPNIIEHLPLTEGYNIVELVAPDIFCDKSILELNLRREYGVELLAIKRADPESKPNVVVVPGAGEIIRKKDKLIMMGSDKDIQQIQDLT